MENKSCHDIFELVSHNNLADLETILKQFPHVLESTDLFSNTPLLYACFCGKSDLVSYLLAEGANYKRINIFGNCRKSHDTQKQKPQPFFLITLQGQNALTLATYSRDLDTCNAILNHCDFHEFNSSGLLSPLCVAALQGNIQIAKLFLTLETPSQNIFCCPSQTIHGICPMQLAQNNGDARMIDLLRSTHQLHLFKNVSNH